MLFVAILIWVWWQAQHEVWYMWRRWCCSRWVHHGAGCWHEHLPQHLEHSNFMAPLLLLSSPLIFRFKLHPLFSNFVHFHQPPCYSEQKPSSYYQLLLPPALLPFFFCCCSEGPCCSGPAVAIASSCSYSVGMVMHLGVDPCCWPVSALLSKLPVASAASS